MTADIDHFTIETICGMKFRYYHSQNCCENVVITDIVGDLDDLVGDPMLIAEHVTSSKELPYGSMTWTFYKFSTIKGSVTVRWAGESNGYYSEYVDLEVTEVSASGVLDGDEVISGNARIFGKEG